jgi:hypothetical protein
MQHPLAPRAYLQRQRLRHRLRRDQLWTEGGEGLEVLRARQESRVALWDAFGRHLEDQAVAGDDRAPRPASAH